MDNQEKKTTDMTENQTEEVSVDQVEPEENEVAEKKEKKPMKKGKKAVIIILCIILVFLLFVIGFGWWYVNDKLNLIDFDTESTYSIAEGQEFVEDEVLDFAEMDDATGNDFKAILKNWATNGGEKMSSKNVINILLIGSDASASEPGRADITDKGNTDALILVSIDKKNKTIKMISFMRDSYTYMAEFDTYGKINAACANGGALYLVDTLENDYKIEIDGYALVDFDSFVEVIDILGGVEVDVPEYVARFLGHGFPSGDNTLLNGEEALRFSRVRYSDADGDVSRVKRQRQVINALIEKAKGASLSELDSVLDAVLANVRTNIPKKDILSYATKAFTEGWANYKITEVTMPSPDARYGYSSAATAWIWVVDYPLAAQKVQMELYGTTNINLAEDRKTAIDVIGGYVQKS